MNNNLEKFQETYNFIKDKVYFCNEDISAGNKRYNTALLLGMLTAATNGSIIYVGEYGLGKTTISESISSLMFSIPKNIIEASSIKGNPELGYEQIIGRPDLGELNKGNEKIIWSDFVFSKPKIVDEINRIPPNKQNILLTGMQSNTWKYLNGYVQTEKGPWFATKNYKDSGNNGIVPPLLDRFNLCVESKTPGINNLRLLRYSEEESLSYDALSQAYQDLITKTSSSYKNFNLGLDAIKDRFRVLIKSEKNLELLTQENLDSIKKEIKNIPFSKESNFLMDVLSTELGSCQLYGQKRTHESCPDDCHFSNYACFLTQNALSNRTVKAIDVTSKAFAWISESSEVNPGHIAKILPYTLWHKTNLTEKELEKYENSSRLEPIQLHATKVLVENILQRHQKLKKIQNDFVSTIINGSITSAKEQAKKLDHPVFKGYLEGLI